MNCLWQEKAKKIKDNIIKGVRNLFRLKREIDCIAIKDIGNLFRLKKKRWSNYR